MQNSVFNAWEPIISHNHVKIVEYVELMVVLTHTIVFYIKTPEKVEESKPQESAKKYKARVS